MIGSLAKNLLGYDGLIVLLAIVNGIYIIPKLKASGYRLRKELQGTVYAPIHMFYESKESSSINLHDLQDLREKEVLFYHIFDTINGIFPLMGILGTIIGLLRMVGMDTTLVMSNFTIALTSTFWGLVFAILFKAIDGTIAPVYMQNQENLQMIFERIDRMKEGEVKV